MSDPLVDQRAIPLRIACKLRNVEVTIFSFNQKCLRAATHAAEYLPDSNGLANHLHSFLQLRRPRMVARRQIRALQLFRGMYFAAIFFLGTYEWCAIAPFVIHGIYLLPKYRC